MAVEANIQINGVEYFAPIPVVDEIERLRDVITSKIDPSAPVEELRGTKPVVLYFGNDADRQEFIALMQEAKPGLIAKAL